MAVFRAYFVHGENIGDHGVLCKIVESIGLPTEEAKTVLTERTFRKDVDEDWERSRQLGVTAVPTLFSGNKRLVGFQSDENLQQLLQ